MTMREDIEVAVGQWLDAGGETITQEATAQAVDDIEAALGDFDDEGWTQAGGPLDLVMTATIERVEVQGDAIREACQMRGQAEAFGLTIKPNGEFIGQSCSDEIKRRSLKGWPESDHWYLTIEDDKRVVTYHQGELSSWVEVLVEAERLVEEWEAQDAAAARARAASIRRAVQRVRDAERKLQEAQQERDNVIREMLADGMSAIDAAHAAGMSRPRIYQIRDAT